MLIVLPPLPSIARKSPLWIVTAFEEVESVRSPTVNPLLTRTGLFVALLTVTVAVTELGTVLGVQLLALLQRSETLPFQSWASPPPGQLSMSPDTSNAGTIDAILPRVALA